MSAAWLTDAPDTLGLLVRATLLLGLAWAAAAALRTAGASASTRHIAWLLGIAALLALPLIWWLAPALPLPILRAEAAAPVAVPLQLPTMPGPAAADSPDYWVSLLLAYAVGAALLLLRIAIFRGMLSRLWRSAEPACGAVWEGLMARVSREMGLRQPVELRIAQGSTMPMTWGTLAPKVLLPIEAQTWPLERRRLVLLHELAHVARRDSLSRSAASLACALYWFHPGAWFAARQMRLEQEHAADDRVLTIGASPRTYALSLVDLARRIDDRSGHAAAMAGMQQLERRLVSITKPARRDLPGPAFLGLSTALAAIVTLIVSAGIPVRPASAVPARPGPEPTVLAPVAADLAAPARAEPGVEPSPQSTGRAEPGASRYTGTLENGADSGVARTVVSQARLGARPMPATHVDEPQIRSQLITPAPSRPINGRPRPSPADGPLLAAYGPNLPAAHSDVDSDARIPELARRRARADADDRRPSRRPPDLGIRLVPAEGASTEINLVEPIVGLIFGRDGP